jgi:hypothetical protein
LLTGSAEETAVKISRNARMIFAAEKTDLSLADVLKQAFSQLITLKNPLRFFRESFAIRRKIDYTILYLNFNALSMLMLDGIRSILDSRNSILDTRYAGISGFNAVWFKTAVDNLAATAFATADSDGMKMA